MARRFYNREEELAALGRVWDAGQGQLVLVWGRRRAGKSYLLAKFAEGKRAIHYTATERAPDIELAEFSEQVRGAVAPGPRDVLAGGPFRSWDEALFYLAAAARQEPLLVVLDEFSYLAANDPALPSVIQRFWDRKGRSSKLRLVLCGSATAVLEGLESTQAPLFGRFTGRLQVHPFGFRDAAAFHPRASAVTKATIFGVLGGMPIYLSTWDADRSVERNLLRLFGDPASPLINEGELLLRTELPEAAGYFRLMAAVAAGKTKFSELKDTAKMDPTRSLEKLVSVRLLDRRVPVTEDPDRTRQRIYQVSDEFLRFWFRFIYPNRGAIERGLGEQVVRNLILPYLDDYMGPVFEELARRYVVVKSAAGQLGPITKVGSWWSTDGGAEVDVVGLSGRKAVLAGEAKWARRVGRRVLMELHKKQSSIPRMVDEPKLLLFGRESFEGLTDKDALLVNAQKLYE